MIPFVPISGWHGDNMLEAFKTMPWYEPGYYEGQVHTRYRYHRY